MIAVVRTRTLNALRARVSEAETATAAARAEAEQHRRSSELAPIATSKDALAALLWIGVTHAVIDRRWPVLWWMTHTGSTDWISRGGAAHVDQTAHIAALVVAALCLSV